MESTNILFINNHNFLSFIANKNTALPTINLYNICIICMPTSLELYIPQDFAKNCIIDGGQIMYI
ncbi:hypothetical protein Hanom_Chr09g00809641 [Helianthus anomalus]